MILGLPCWIYLIIIYPGKFQLALNYKVLMPQIMNIIPIFVGSHLTKLCGVKEPPHEQNVESNKDGKFFVNHAFSVSMILGFITRLSITFTSIIVNRLWRQVYFRLLNNLTANIYHMIAIKVAKYTQEIIMVESPKERRKE